ncbi:MAG TPA: class I SAM-dependent methyltransferase [Burkholderiales bacterium]|nr:class I SAM-dependent methyltransferase [Burkholderiales bacterium]
MTEIHIAARQGFSTEAQTYMRGRPDYPADILPWLADDLGVVPGKLVVDLGAGTGKFTRMLLQTGADIIAVEPVEAMRMQLTKSLSGVGTLAGNASAIPLKSASVDAVICAQSFHWFATHSALREIHRILKPGAKLGLVWNVRDESLDWVEAMSRIITPYEGDVPRFYRGDWRKPFSGEYFTAPEQTVFAYQHVGTAEEVILDRVLSISFIAALTTHEKSKVADQLRALIASHPTLRGRDTIAFPYRTEAYRCTSLD